MPALALVLLVGDARGREEQLHNALAVDEEGAASLFFPDGDGGKEVLFELQSPLVVMFRQNGQS